MKHLMDMLQGGWAPPWTSLGGSPFSGLLKRRQ